MSDIAVDYNYDVLRMGGCKENLNIQVIGMAVGISLWYIVLLSPRHHKFYPFMCMSIANLAYL